MGLFSKIFKKEEIKNNEEVSKSQSTNSFLTAAEKQDIKNIIDGSTGTVDERTGISFYNILKNNPDLDKNNILKEFDDLAQMLIKEDPIKCNFSIPFLLGILNGNHIISESEMIEVRDKYLEQIKEIVFSDEFNQQENKNV